MAACTQGNSRFSVIIIVTSSPPCNQGEPWKEHWRLCLSWEKGCVGTGVCWCGVMIQMSKGSGVWPIHMSGGKLSWQMVVPSQVWLPDVQKQHYAFCLERMRFQW